ncbi:MAG: hypothetical protein HBSIN01_35160 [Candidatus Brocadia sinica]|uniref:cation-transporting P-type ATPase n=1 Tax=Candidatus Brocadia sp. AMX2 TaxID=2293635 RepID=UPI001A544831|nr:MAG: hypothetical protein BroJett002_13380 [Candidatus Brocadia sinica]GJQ19557.1 MAG: hypothetical protein HBSIN01_35160 [Candidatus Brocadia sinica]
MADKMIDTSWHTMSVDEVIRRLDTNPDTGLSNRESDNRLRKYGYNQLEEKEGVSPPIALFGTI